MAQSGYTPISLYYSTTASALPTAGNLVAGELALNTLDEKLYFKNSSGTVKLLASVTATTNVSSITFGSTGLTPNTATTGAVTVAGTLAVANGGTGITSFGTGVAGALGQNVSGTGSIALTTSAVLTTPNLGTPSAGTLTSCTGLPLSTGVTGTLAITNGGTGQTTASTAFNALSPLTTLGDTLYGGASGAGTRLGIGTTSQVLTVVGGVPAWATPSGGVTTISFGSTGFTPSTATSGAVSVAGTLAIANGGTGSTSTTYCSLTSNVTGTLPVANGGTGNATATAYAVQCGGTTSTGAHQSIASVGTTGQVLTSNGAGALPTFQAAAGGFASGTRMSFQQTSAPTGWTKDTTSGINDAILRLVTGTVTSGGTTAFSTWNAQTASGATTLSTAQMPSHTHTATTYDGEGGTAPKNSVGSSSYPSGYLITSNATGGGGSHTHSLTQSIKYYDFIIASKD